MGKRGLLANNAQFVSVDLVGEKNLVILEYVLLNDILYFMHSIMRCWMTYFLSDILYCVVAWHTLCMLFYSCVIYHSYRVSTWLCHLKLCVLYGIPLSCCLNLRLFNQNM